MLCVAASPAWLVRHPVQQMPCLAVSTHIKAAAAAASAHHSSSSGYAYSRPQALTTLPPLAIDQQEGGWLQEASDLCIHCGAFAQGVSKCWPSMVEIHSGSELRGSLRKGDEGLAVGVCTQGLLRAAAEWSCQATSSPGTGTGRGQEEQVK